jgi:hypothetical protein
MSERGRDDGNVITLKVPMRSPDSRPQFEITKQGGCGHYCPHVTYAVDAQARTVTCSCGAALDPFFVLEQMARADSRFVANRTQAREASERLTARARTKCIHCEKMTPIKGIL